MLLNVLNTSSFADEARPSQPGASARQHVTLIQFMKYFKDLDNDITTKSDALKEWLTTPTIELEKGVDAIAWWLAMLTTGHSFARMALDFLSIPGMYLLLMVVCIDVLTLLL